MSAEDGKAGGREINEKEPPGDGPQKTGQVAELRQ